MMVTAAAYDMYLLLLMMMLLPDAMVALAEDHLNDILSNMAAVATAGIAGYWAEAWWVDPAGAIVISLYILWRWADIAKIQVRSRCWAAFKVRSR